MHLRLKMMLASWSAFSCALALCNSATLAQTALPQVDVTVASPIRAARRHGLHRSPRLHSLRQLSRRQPHPRYIGRDNSDHHRSIRHHHGRAQR